MKFFKSLFFVVSVVLFFVVPAIHFAAAAALDVVAPSNAGFIEQVVGLIGATWPERATRFFSVLGVLSMLAQFVPEKYVNEYGDKRWFNWLIWFIHRFGGNNFAAKNAG